MKGNFSFASCAFFLNLFQLTHLICQLHDFVEVQDSEFEIFPTKTSKICRKRQMKCKNSQIRTKFVFFSQIKNFSKSEKGGKFAVEFVQHCIIF